MPRYSESLARTGGKGREVQKTIAHHIARRQSEARAKEAEQYRRGEIDTAPRPATTLDAWAEAMEKKGNEVVDLNRVWRGSKGSKSETRKLGEPPRGWKNLPAIAFELQTELSKEGRKFNMLAPEVKSAFMAAAEQLKQNPGNKKKFGKFSDPDNPEDASYGLLVEFFDPRLAKEIKILAATKLRV